MIKAFISHSNQQKAYAKALVEILSRTACILEEYDFEPAKKVKMKYSEIFGTQIFLSC